MNVNAASDETRRSITRLVTTALVGSPFRGGPAAWRTAVAVIRQGEVPTAMARTDFIGWCRANGLDALANEATKRQVPRGSVLVYVEIDDDTDSGAELSCFDFRSALLAYDDGPTRAHAEDRTTHD